MLADLVAAALQSFGRYMAIDILRKELSANGGKQRKVQPHARPG